MQSTFECMSHVVERETNQLLLFNLQYARSDSLGLDSVVVLGAGPLVASGLLGRDTWETEDRIKHAENDARIKTPAMDLTGGTW